MQKTMKKIKELIRRKEIEIERYNRGRRKLYEEEREKLEEQNPN
jgi:hypothetical protein